MYMHICSRWQHETSEYLKGPHLRSPASRQEAAHQLLQPAMSLQAVTATQIGPGVDESAVSQAGRASVGRETRGLGDIGGQVKQVGHVGVFDMQHMQRVCDRLREWTKNVEHRQGCRSACAGRKAVACDRQLSGGYTEPSASSGGRQASHGRCVRSVR